MRVPADGILNAWWQGLLRHRVVSRTAPGVAAEEPADCQIEPFERTVFLECLQGVYGTGRREAAGVGKIRGDEQFVELDQHHKWKDGNLLHGFPKLSAAGIFSIVLHLNCYLSQLLFSSRSVDSAGDCCQDFRHASAYLGIFQHVLYAVDKKDVCAAFPGYDWKEIFLLSVSLSDPALEKIPLDGPAEILLRNRHDYSIV